MTAVIEPVVRGEVEPFSDIRVSPSRVNSYLQCGVAFKRKYIDGERAKVVGSAALFGNVMHKANEWWSMDRSQDMVTLTARAWLDVTAGTPIVQFLNKYQSLSVEAMQTEAEVKRKWEADPRNKGKTSKSPRMTKLWKESAVAGKIDRLMEEWIPKLNADSMYKFSESDPLPNLYDESLILAKRYSRKYRDYPAALHAEFGFAVDWNGFTLRGFIDAIEPVDVGDIQIVDYKTYRGEAPAAKDWRQGVMYDIAVEQLCQSGQLPFSPDANRYIVFDYMRLLKRKDYIYGEADRIKLLEELSMYQRGVNAGVFLPADKNMRVDFCDFPENCCQLQRGEHTNQRGNIYGEDEE